MRNHWKIADMLRGLGQTAEQWAETVAERATGLPVELESISFSDCEARSNAKGSKTHFSIKQFGSNPADLTCCTPVPPKRGVPPGREKCVRVNDVTGDWYLEQIKK